jgi:hypothetical protein
MSQKFNGRLVDSLGALLAQSAELNKQISAIKKKLKEQGLGAYEGELFRVTVSESISYKLDMDAVRAKLSPQFIRAHEYPVTKVDVRCVARNNENLEVAA